MSDLSPVFRCWARDLERVAMSFRFNVVGILMGRVTFRQAGFDLLNVTRLAVIGTGWTLFAVAVFLRRKLRK
jgi:hypothetical protein